MKTQILVPSSAQLSTWIRSTWLGAGRRAPFVLIGLLVCLNWPGVALATLASGFASDVTKVSFDSVNIIYGQGQKNDSPGTPKGGDDAKIRLIVKDPADYYIVTNTVVSGGIQRLAHTLWPQSGARQERSRERLRRRRPDLHSRDLPGRKRLRRSGRWPRALGA